MIIGYGRVSTDGQSLESQEASLKAAGAERIFAEKISGAITDRKALAKAIAALGPGDVLLVTRLDRLARSTRDLLNTLDTISKAGAKFKSLADAWADTTTPHGELMVTILGGLATFERHPIRARTDEGRKQAQARGVRFGRKAQAYSVSNQGSSGEEGRRRDPERYRTLVWGQSLNNIETVREAGWPRHVAVKEASPSRPQATPRRLLMAAKRRLPHDHLRRKVAFGR